MELIGRHAECATLEHLVESVRAGESRVLVLHGEAGVGKTALLDYLAGQAPDCRVARVAGVESEMELAFAGLHQLSATVFESLGKLPSPQRDALQTALGISAGPVPDRFLVGLAVLSLLADAADERPLICLLDDEQWIDQASAQVFSFVARRLMAESVGIVFAARVPGGHLAGLPELVVTGLKAADARTLLDTAVTAPLDVQLREQIIAEARGNPLALLELPRGLTPSELAGGFGLPGTERHAGRIEDSFRRRLDALPYQTRRLLLLAAAETTGDAALVWQAAARLGISSEAAEPAAEADLIEFGARVRFRHPLVRSAAYRGASLDDRREVHRALGEVTDPKLDADRRAWHRAHSASGPDEDVAAELERSAGRARARGGVAAAAAFLERATMLTLDLAQRTERALAAASTMADAGYLDAAQDLLAIAQMGALSNFQQARVVLLRAQFAFISSRGSDAPPLLLKAAKLLEPIDADLARDTYLDSLSAALFAGRLAVGGGALDVARRAGAKGHAPPTARPPDLLLDGFATYYDQGYAAGLPILRRALTTFGSGMSVVEELRWLWLACVAAMHVWDDKRWQVLSERHVQLARNVGALSELPLALSSRAYTLLFAGDLPAAASLIEEAQAVTEVTGSKLAPYGSLGLAAFRGHPAEVSVLAEAAIKDATRRGEGNAITIAQWATAVLNNGLGQYKKAIIAAQHAASHPEDLGGAHWAAVELVEAAVRCGRMDLAAEAHCRLEEMTNASGTDWALGVEARSGALISEGETAERLYRQSIERLDGTCVQAELARAHLLYGEWLRRELRRGEARARLRLAYDMLETMGMEAFAGRARRELHAAGEITRNRAPALGAANLTAQETQVARLARDGLSNPEIGNRLFISARTVQYHLRKVFAKLGISSRSQLDGVLP